MKDKIAIKVDNLSKDFKIPHEKYTTLKQHVLHIFNKKPYIALNALKNVSFEVKKGEFFGILGRNGSGKSTLLKILAGIYIPDEGRVKINGKLSPFLELGVGFNPELTASENVFLGGAILGLTKEEIRKKLDKIIKFAELEKFVDMKFKNFSSGMQVRLAFSLAIHAHAEILLMDEVLAVGDSNFQSKCLEEFNNYRNQGKTVVLVSHDIGTIQRYCDRALFLRNGKIIKIGDAENVGSEYIKQNMRDEEERVNQDEVMEAEKETGNEITKKRAVKITKVMTLDDKGKNKKIFNTGDDIILKVFFEKNKSISSLNVGIGIYKDDGSYILGYNTLMDKFSIKKNTVELKFKTLPLLKGAYYVNVVCFGEIEEKYYDFKDKIVTLRIFPIAESDKYRGAVNIEHSWR